MGGSLNVLKDVIIGAGEADAVAGEECGIVGSFDVLKDVIMGVFEGDTAVFVERGVDVLEGV